jgi:hypothetical protein
MSEALNSRSNLIRQYIGIAASVLGMAGLAWYIVTYSSEFHRLRDIPVVGIVLLSVIVLIGHLLIAIKFQLMAFSFHVPLALWEAFLLTEAGGFLNIVPLGLGTGFRAAYLKKVRNLRFVDFGLGLLASMFTEFLAAGSLGIVFSLSIPNVTLALQFVFLGYILVPPILLMFVWLLRGKYRHRLFTEHRGRDWLSRFLRSLIIGLETILDQPLVVFYWFLLNLLTDFVLGTRYWLVGGWLGYSMDFASGMVLQSVSRATAIIALVPSGTIGLREALTGLGAVGLGQSAVSGVMISTIDRIVATAWIVSLGATSLFALRKKIAKSYASDTAEPGVSV